MFTERRCIGARAPSGKSARSAIHTCDAGRGIHARAVVAAPLPERALPSCREAARYIEADLSAAGPEREARALVERLALLAGAADLRECAPPIIGDIFARTRLAERHSGLFGTSVVESADADVIPRRALPVVINPS